MERQSTRRCREHAAAARQEGRWTTDASPLCASEADAAHSNSGHLHSIALHAPMRANMTALLSACRLTMLPCACA